MLNMSQRDFTPDKYSHLVRSIKEQGLKLQTVAEYISNPGSRTVLLRHDVDYQKHTALTLAHILHDHKVRGTFYFRAIPKIFDPNVIKETYELGHEVGYHYEDLALARGNLETAIQSFQKNLARFRQLVPINTICMHGSPISRHDNRNLWKRFDYKSYNIIGEPYFDIDFNHTLYLSDTGGHWNGNRSRIRDKVKSNFKHSFKSTDDIIGYLKEEKPDHSFLFNFHPHRWIKNIMPWYAEKYKQKTKNSIKVLVNTIRNT